MKFEIINPSDPYTIEAPDLMIAAVLAMYLGSGAYALDGLGDDKGQEVPIFFFGGADQWCQDKFSMSAQDLHDKVANERLSELIVSLESIRLESKRRSSLNDIGRSARRIAAHLRSWQEWNDRCTR